MLLDLRNKFLEFKEEQKQYEEAGIESRVLLIDGTNTYIRCFAASNQMNDNGDHVGGVSGFLKSVGATIRQFRPSRVVCVFDGKGGSQRRRKVYKDYKDNRKSMTKLNRTYNFNDVAEEKQSMQLQMLHLIDLLDDLPVNVFAVDNVEADDVIAYLSHLVQERGGKSIIFSTDKDFLQLANENCSVYNPVKKKMYGPNEILRDYGIHPINFLIYRIIEGDKGDNIPGVKGVAKKTLLKNFPYLSEEVDKSMKDIIQDCTYDDKPRNKSCEKILKAHEEGILERNEILMDLGDVNISGTTKLQIVDLYDKLPHEYNQDSFTKKMIKYELGGTLGDHKRWLRTTWIPLTRFINEKSGK